MTVSPHMAASRASKCLAGHGWMASWIRRGSLPDVDGIVKARQGKAHLRAIFIGPPSLAYLWKEWRQGKWTREQHSTATACLKAATR